MPAETDVLSSKKENKTNTILEENKVKETVVY